MLCDRDTICSLGAAEGLAMIEWYCRPGPTLWVWTFHNFCMARTGRLAAWGRKIFDPVKIFKGGGPTAILGVLWFVDYGLMCLRKQMSVMTAIFKKA